MQQQPEPKPKPMAKPKPKPEPEPDLATDRREPIYEVENAAIRKFHYYRAYTLMKHVKCQCSCM